MYSSEKNITRYHATSTNYNIISNRYTRTYLYSSTNPHIIPHCYRPCIFQSLISSRRVDWMTSLYENHNWEQQKHYLQIFAHTLWGHMMTDLYFLHFLERKSPPNILVQAFPSSAVTFPFSRLEIKLVLKPVTSAKYAYVYPIRFLCCCIAFPKSTTSMYQTCCDKKDSKGNVYPMEDSVHLLILFCEIFECCKDDTNGCSPCSYQTDHHNPISPCLSSCIFMHLFYMVPIFCHPRYSLPAYFQCHIFRLDALVSFHCLNLC